MKIARISNSGTTIPNHETNRWPLRNSRTKQPGCSQRHAKATRLLALPRRRAMNPRVDAMNDHESAEERKAIERQPTLPSQPLSRDEGSRDVRPPTRGPGSHSNNPYLLEHSYGLGVLAQRDPVSIRLRVSKRVEAIPPPPRSGGAPGGPRNPIKHEEKGGHPPLGVGQVPPS